MKLPITTSNIVYGTSNQTKVTYVHNVNNKRKQTKLKMAKRQYMAVIAGPIAVIAIIISVLNTGILETLDDRIENIKIEVTYQGT